MAEALHNSDVSLDHSGSVLRPSPGVALQAARQLVAERGLNISMEDVAAASGVGRRTLFRYFPSRDSLVAQAVEMSLDAFDEEVAKLPDTELPLHAWLREVVIHMYRAHLGAGRGLWELAATADEKLPIELAHVNRRRRESRRQSTQMLASAAWHKAVGSFDVPQEVVDAFAMCLSTFTSQSMIDDFKTDIESVATTTALMLEMFLTE